MPGEGASNATQIELENGQLDESSTLRGSAAEADEQVRRSGELHIQWQCGRDNCVGAATAPTCFRGRQTQDSVVILVSALALAGCGRTDDTDGPLTIDDSPATGEIIVWTAGGNDGRLAPFIETFESDNPEASVEVTDVPWNEMVTKVTSAIAAGTAPDLVLMGLADIPTLIAADGVQPVAEGVVDSSTIFSDVQEATPHRWACHAASAPRTQ